VNPVRPARADLPGVEQLVACNKFHLDRWELTKPRALSPDDRFHILAVIEGSAALTGIDGTRSLRRGDTVLLPAAAKGVEVAGQGRAVLLDMYLP
jgi:mannose-6-phosphate isomerase class I